MSKTNVAQELRFNAATWRMKGLCLLSRSRCDVFVLAAFLAFVVSIMLQNFSGLLDAFRDSESLKRGAKLRGASG